VRRRMKQGGRRASRDITAATGKTYVCGRGVGYVVYLLRLQGRRLVAHVPPFLCNFTIFFLYFSSCLTTSSTSRRRGPKHDHFDAIYVHSVLIVNYVDDGLLPTTANDFLRYLMTGKNCAVMYHMDL
jgi:hypothetical protein